MKKNLILFVAILGAGLFFTGLVFAVDVLPDGAIKQMIVNDKGVDENGVPITEFILDFPESGQEQGATGGAVLEPGADEQEPVEEASGDVTLTETDNGEPWNLNSLLAGLANFFRIENLQWILLLAVIISAGLFWLLIKKRREEKKK